MSAADVSPGDERPSTPRSPAGGIARERICEGAARAVVRQGAAVSMAEIATECGVSKALLHYHYADRAGLLAEVLHRLAGRLVGRERAALGAAPAGTALDALWRWLAAELQRGELRALLELGTVRDAAVRDVAEQVARARRESAAATTALVFAQLGLAPRVPAALLGEASVAFIDGLALDAGSGRDPRVSFDVYWLAMLSLGE